MTIDMTDKKVRSFSLSEATIDMIRADIEKGAAEGRYGPDYVAASKNMPFFVTVPLINDRALVGEQEENHSNDEFALKYERPTEKIEPLSLICSAIFVGRSSCYVEYVLGDYSRWIWKPNC